MTLADRRAILRLTHEHGLSMRAIRIGDEQGTTDNDHNCARALFLKEAAEALTGDHIICTAAINGHVDHDSQSNDMPCCAPTIE